MRGLQTTQHEKELSMGTVREFSDHVVDIAERVADVADAAQGKGIRRGGMSIRWLVLSAAGAGVYALATSDSVVKRAKGVVHGAKTRASELPDDLIGRVQDTVSSPGGGQKNGSGTRRSQKRTSGSRQGRARTQTRSRKSASTR
jgi:hypothetical protein